MKYFLFICIPFISAFSQIIPVEMKGESMDKINAKTYFKDINGVMNKFIGEWVFQNDNEYFELQISLLEYAGTSSYFEDRLCVSILYTRDNHIILKHTIFDDNNCSVYGNRFLDKSLNKIQVVLPGFSEGFRCGDIYFLDLTKDYENVLTWELTNNLMNDLNLALKHFPKQHQLNRR